MVLIYEFHDLILFVYNILVTYVFERYPNVSKRYKRIKIIGIALLDIGVKIFLHKYLELFV